MAFPRRATETLACPAFYNIYRPPRFGRKALPPLFFFFSPRLGGFARYSLLPRLCFSAIANSPSMREN
jgi:hypothetical protein